jgi:hypothetical protein
MPPKTKWKLKLKLPGNSRRNMRDKLKLLLKRPRLRNSRDKGFRKNRKHEDSRSLLKLRRPD